MQRRYTAALTAQTKVTGGKAVENSRYLIFVTDEKRFSLPFDKIRIILAAQKPAPAPDFPEYIPGTITHEGKMIPVIDLRRRFHYTPKEISDRDCIIITASESPVGLLCDSVQGFTEVEEENIQPAPKLNEDVSTSFISGEFLMEDKPCYILDGEKIVKLSDREAVKNALCDENNDDNDRKDMEE